MPAVSVQSVTKSYAGRTAVRDISFHADRGEIVGFVGPNGAGKSTVLRMIATYLAPTRGRIAVDGFDTVTAPLDVRRRIGYLSGDTPLYPAMRVRAFLRFVGAARGLDGDALSGGLDRVVDLAGLSPVLDLRIHACSTGFRQRVAFAGALIHDPPILILDEPTHGFDPLQVLAFRDTLRALRPGRAILFSSHIIQEVAALSDRLLIIHEGRLLADGTPSELARAAGLPPSATDEVFAHLVRSASPAEGTRPDASRG